MNPQGSKRGSRGLNPPQAGDTPGTPQKCHDPGRGRRNRFDRCFPLNKQSIPAILRLYVTAVGLVTLGSVVWHCYTFIHTPDPGGWDLSRIWDLVVTLVPYVLFILFLLFPWWRLGYVIRALGYAIAIPIYTYIVVSFLIVDVIYFHQKTFFQGLLLSGLMAHILWLFLPLVVEFPIQTAELCKRHLRHNHQNKLSLVERFILEIEGEDQDIGIWSSFIDTENDKALKRLDLVFEKWLKRENVSRPAGVGPP